jgi:UDP-glucose 4-epimerase
VNQLAATIGSMLSKPVEIVSEPPRPGDVRDSWADVTAAREALGYELSVPLEEGLRLTADAFGV